MKSKAETQKLGKAERNEVRLKYRERKVNWAEKQLALFQLNNFLSRYKEDSAHYEDR